jgi:hypothetical protein
MFLGYSAQKKRNLMGYCCLVEKWSRGAYLGFGVVWFMACCGEGNNSTSTQGIPSASGRTDTDEHGQDSAELLSKLNLIIENVGEYYGNFGYWRGLVRGFLRICTYLEDKR